MDVMLRNAVVWHVEEELREGRAGVMYRGSHMT
jgi:hypothetical protein